MTTRTIAPRQHKRTTNPKTVKVQLAILNQVGTSRRLADGVVPFADIVGSTMAVMVLILVFTGGAIVAVDRGGVNVVVVVAHVSPFWVASGLTAPGTTMTTVATISTTNSESRAVVAYGPNAMAGVEGICKGVV